MPDYQVRVVLPFRSGLPEDVAVNTYAVSGPSIEPDFGGDLVTAFTDLYNTAAGANPICEWLSPALSRATDAARLEVYEIDLTPGSVGAPLFVAEWTLGSGPSSADDLLPNEVAICSSYAGPGTPGTPAGRRRGRVYIGPLRGSVIGHNTTTFQPQVLPLVVEDIRDSFEKLWIDLDAADGMLCVWSRADQALHGVNRGWVDSEFDTQRRRGIDATSRLSWNAP